MKKVTIILLSVIAMSCEKETNEYVPNYMDGIWIAYNADQPVPMGGFIFNVAGNRVVATKDFVTVAVDNIAYLANGEGISFDYTFDGKFYDVTIKRYEKRLYSFVGGNDNGVNILKYID